MSTTMNDHTFATSVVVKASQEKAWQVFTANIGTWWPKGHSIAKAGQKNLFIEPFVGGRWYEIGTDDEQCDWGKVLTWDPFGRLVLTWQLSAQFAYDPDFITEIEVTFETVDGGTRVTLQHKNLDKYGPMEEKIKETFSGEGGWNSILQLYVAVVG